MIGLIVLAVLGLVLIGLGTFAAPGLAVLVPALAIPDVGSKPLGVLAILAAAIAIVIASVYTTRLVLPLLRALTMRRREPALSLSEEVQEKKATAECNERLRRGISYRAALSGLLRPEGYPVTCPKQTR